MSIITNLRIWYATRQVMNYVHNSTVPSATHGNLRVGDVRHHPLMKEALTAIRAQAKELFAERLADGRKPGAERHQPLITYAVKDAVITHVSKMMASAVPLTAEDVPYFSAASCAQLINWYDRAESAQNQAIRAYREAVRAASARPLTSSQTIESSLPI